jgi:hypothetical protein
MNTAQRRCRGRAAFPAGVTRYAVLRRRLGTGNVREEKDKAKWKLKGLLSTLAVLLPAPNERTGPLHKYPFGVLIAAQQRQFRIF